MNNVFQAALHILPRIVADLEAHHPRAIVLFGSMARLQAGIDTKHRPQDIDLLVVGDQIPIGFETKAYGFPTEITRMRT
ncbi:MAG: nucleotidyltransferase domain-containing protein, partial [Desulfobacteraceae bacterium]|nr:nucleotidyltransferase domain-containing protein [Desulfobacteraceae bacterium]